MGLCRYYDPTKVKEATKSSSRIATNSCNDTTSEPFIQEFSLFNMKQVVYKALYNEAPHYMKELFHKLSETNSRELRNSLIDLYVPSLRTSMGHCLMSISFTP